MSQEVVNAKEKELKHWISINVFEVVAFEPLDNPDKNNKTAFQWL